MSSGSFTFGPSAVVSSDGKELLAYAPGDESPLWKKALAAPAAFLATAGDDVYALDARGTLLRLAADTGVEWSKETFVGEPRALAARGGGADGHVAVALEDSVVILQGDARTTLSLTGAQALAFSTKLLAIGTDAGKLRVVDGATTVGEADLGGPVRGVVRHPAGFWLASAKDGVFRVSDDGEVTPFLRASGKAPAALACSKDGALVAVQTGPKDVAVLAFPTKDTLATATYPERTATGVGLTGDGRFLWIGIDKGDANKVDLEENDVYRTDPHAGRARTAWVLKVQIDKGVRAALRARPKAKATASDGPHAAVRPPPTAAGTSPTADAGADQEEGAHRGPPEPELPPSSEADKRLVLTVLFGATLAAIVSLFFGR